MKHTTLYRKWRPRRFGEVAGQEAVVRTLRRAIETDRVAHAYLFSGPRGTGKTSTAKVLAMGLNCANGPTPEPDGTCESCRAIVNNSSMDVVEMDAASNRGIDEVRELRDRVNLAPASGRMKVYIIDEVHMLTTEAFNALLKMLEEPPEHVVFVLATTEKHRVLPTIISRCQSFNFRRPGVPVLAEKLKEIAEAEEIEVEPEALTVIAGAGGGSFRDAEGLLDQLSSFADGPVTAAMVRELLGSVGSGVLIEAAATLHERRAADALRIVDRLSNEGKDLGQFVAQLLSHLRNLMLIPHAPEVALAEVGAEERAPLEEQAKTIPTAEVVRAIEALGEARGRIRRGGDPKLELELTFLKLTRDYTEPSVDALLQRLETLERAVENGNLASVAKPPTGEPEDITPVHEIAQSAETSTKPAEEGPADESIEEPRREETVESAGGGGDAVSVRDLASAWDGLMQGMKDQHQAPAAAVYEEARVEGFDGKLLRLAFPEDLAIYAKLASDERHANALQAALERRFGVRPRLECRVGGENGSPENGGSAPVEEPVRAPARRDPAVESEMTPDFDPPDLDSPGAESASSGEPGADHAGGQRPPEAQDDDGTIGSEQEVLAIAREWFGSSNDNGGR